MIRTRICKNCEKEFSYEVAPGRDRIHCSAKCQVDYKKKLDKIRINSLPKCKTEDCNGKATRKESGLCEACYMRLYRHGTTKRREKKGWTEKKDGYIIYFVKDHPLSTKSKMLSAHRYIAYDKYGPGPHNCHWCNAELTWDQISIDHLNDNKQDNRPENLVVSCNTCNRLRGSFTSFARRLTNSGFDTLIKVLTEQHCNSMKGNRILKGVNDD